jgi:hypothetical protein
MTLRFSNSLDDIVEFNRYHLTASPELLIARRRSTIIVGLALILCGVALGLAQRSWSLSVLVVAGGGVGMLLQKSLSKKSLARRLDKTLRRMLSEGSNEGILGPRTLRLTEDGLEEESSTGRQFVRYPAIGRIIDTEGYLFVYLNSVQAVVIPKKEVAATDLDAFVVALRARMAVQHGVAPDDRSPSAPARG